MIHPSRLISETLYNSKHLIIGISTFLSMKFELKVFNGKLSNRRVTLNFVGRIKWNTIASPSAKLWSTANFFHPPLSPHFWAKYTVGHSSPVSSTKVIASSLLGRFFLQKLDGRPCSMSHKWVSVSLVQQQQLLLYGSSLSMSLHLSEVWG